MAYRIRQQELAALVLAAPLICPGIQAFGCSGVQGHCGFRMRYPAKASAPLTLPDTQHGICNAPEYLTPEPSAADWARWWGGVERPRTARHAFMLNGHRVVIFREALLPGWRYPCTNDELEAALRALPAAWTARLRSVRLTYHPEWDAFARTDRARIEISYIVDAALHAPGEVEDDRPEELRFGARLGEWRGQRRIVWRDADAARTYLLRHILIHELGHHVAPPGLSRDDEEEWAEAFAYRFYTPAPAQHIAASR